MRTLNLFDPAMTVSASSPITWTVSVARFGRMTLKVTPSEKPAGAAALMFMPQLVITPGLVTVASDGTMEKKVSTVP